MKAVFFEEHGGIEQLKYGELSDPEPGPGDALIKVKAVALNRLDIWVRRGWKGLNLSMPHIGGSDIAGEIVSVNVPDSTWQPGTRVVVNPGVVSYEDEWTRKGMDSVSPGYKIIGEQLKGGMAEYVCVPVQNVFKLPDNIPFTEAAAPLLVGTTCWRMLFKRGTLNAGESVLVVGSGGGVNSLAISLAKAVGATVYALAGNDYKRKKALKLGASEVIDYSKNPAWAADILKLTKGRGVDLVVDNVGAATIENSIRAAARGGRIVTVGNTSGHMLSYDNRLIFTRQISIIGSTMGSRQDFIDAVNFMWNNKIQPTIDTIAPLKDGIKMIRRLEEGRHFGKIVLEA